MRFLYSTSRLAVPIAPRNLSVLIWNALWLSFMGFFVTQRVIYDHHYLGFDLDWGHVFMYLRLDVFTHLLYPESSLFWLICSMTAIDPTLDNGFLYRALNPGKLIVIANRGGYVQALPMIRIITPGSSGRRRIRKGKALQSVYSLKSKRKRHHALPSLMPSFRCIL